MRLWHQALLPLLPRAQILGQHRECCALRGKGWGKKHSTVNYVFTHSYKKLVDYHFLVLKEMEHRGYTPDPKWYSPEYRGKNIGPWPNLLIKEASQLDNTTIFPEHNKDYLEECIANLRQKGIDLKVPFPGDSCSS
ncbi:DNA-(apurinic or apyrimidinic site) lyase, Pyrimidine dimer DNA glycosylase [Desulfosporosinus acidiphilus SJ4]|uniref:DNA-(Apurinic or apyrimidinic site) lyase, Pyrimidine dimer DNA glycosylase n=1 Tax=Desulfosporosinus acidiphilus (strain DSM 22704 / JCM 16185 / SJ4) TaxID=646529 RepID=I4D677_DESAJ|nr:TIGR02328 family protein [Desulfosporosinus acidiphilus]AFM41301.1 DNA-(apurinic or apyrimidinic site) lyase, Pyrimidine dimer DNA glycosylase [Desulfosporosinus acidiphilus SJ4]